MLSSAGAESHPDNASPNGASHRRIKLPRPYDKRSGKKSCDYVKKNLHGKMIEQVNHYFGGERYNFATADLTKTFINNRIKTLTGANIQPIKNMQHFGKGYVI